MIGGCMTKNVKFLMATILSVAGTIMMVYVGGWLLFVSPLLSLYRHFMDHSLTGRLLLVDLIKIFFAATAGGAIWCIFDIAAGYFRDDKGDAPWPKEREKQETSERKNKNI